MMYRWFQYRKEVPDGNKRVLTYRDGEVTIMRSVIIDRKKVWLNDAEEICPPPLLWNFIEYPKEHHIKYSERRMRK